MIVYKDCAAGETVMPSHYCKACGEGAEFGGIRSVILVKGNSPLADLTKATLSTLVESGEAVIIPETRGSFDGGTPKEVDGYGDNKTEVLGADYVLTFKDPVYAKNKEFWDAAKGANFKLMYRTETKLHVVEESVRIKPKAPVEEDTSTAVVWTVEATWFAKASPKIVEAAEFKDLMRCFEIKSEVE